MGCQKLGQPVPDSNLVLESKRTVSQQMQWYNPSAWLLAYLPVPGTSVPACRVTWNCSAVNCFFRAAGAVSPIPNSTAPVGTPDGSNSTMRTTCFFPEDAKADKFRTASAAGSAAPKAFRNIRRCNGEELKMLTYLPPFTMSGNSARRFVSLGRSL